MWITLRVEGANGESLGDIVEETIAFVALTDEDDHRTSCLRFIDPYGDTVFNALQLPVVISELESRWATSTDIGLRRDIDRALDIIRRAIDAQPHAYLRLIGD